MSPDPFPLAAYFERIGWNGPTPATPATLAALHRHQALAIPFENLDPLVGRPVSLDPEDLFRKLLRERRGGYCFELNGLFLRALQAMGFTTTPLCARVQISEGNYGPRMHQITLVDFGGERWIADVGFGGNGLIEAIPFALDEEFDQGLDRFRLRADATHGYRLEHAHPEGWRTIYAFSLDPFLPVDFRALSFFAGGSPESIFTQTPICIRTTPTERRILVADQFKVRTARGGKTVTPIGSTNHLRDVLSRHFGLDLPADFPLPAPKAAPEGMRRI